MAKFAVILAAAGKSSRFQRRPTPSPLLDMFASETPAMSAAIPQKKPFAMLGAKAVWLHSADKFLARDDVRQVIVAIAPEDEQDFQVLFGANVAINGMNVVLGGETRAETVQRALAAVRDDIDYIAVHDAARPCLTAAAIDRVFSKAQDSGAAILAAPIVGTVKRVDGDEIVETVSRDGLWEAQTPQVFRRPLLVDAYRQRGDFQPTDEAQLVERHGHTVAIVAGSRANLKITTPEDLKLASHLL